MKSTSHLLIILFGTFKQVNFRELVLNNLDFIKIRI